MLRKRRLLTVVLLPLIVVSAALLTGGAAAAQPPATTGTVLLDETFSNQAAGQDFTLVCGGQWIAGGYVYTLADAVTSSACLGNANLVVANRTLSGNWTLAVRLAATPTLPGRDGFSVIFGFVDASHYFYANFSEKASATTDGMFRVAGTSVTQLASFAGGVPPLVANRCYDITLVAVGSTVSIADDGVSVGVVSDPTLSGITRVGLGSQGSDVAARHFDVTAAAAGTPSQPPQTTPTPTLAPSGSPNPTPKPTSTPTATPKPTSTLTPTPRPTPTPAQTPTPTPTPSASGACSPGSFPVAAFAPSLVGPVTRTFSEQFIANEGSYIETCYPAGSTSPSSGQPGGSQAQLAIASGATSDTTLTYQIRFPVGFQWVKGGKLPGLCGGQCWTGSNNGPGGWAARFMWRPNGAGEVLLSDATTTGYGSDLGLGDWQFQADGQWHTLTEHVHMNTPGQTDGWIDVTYNGVLVAHLTGIEFRAAGDTDAIDGLMFSTFFGGHDSSWAPSATMSIDFAGFAVH